MLSEHTSNTATVVFYDVLWYDLMAAVELVGTL